jgi:hypothetical protein
MFILIFRGLQNRAFAHAEGGQLIVIVKQLVLLAAVIATPEAEFVHDFVKPGIDHRVKHIETIP